MSADELRQAAETLRERASASIDPPWFTADWTDHAHDGTPVVAGGYGNYIVAKGGGNELTYIATMHPGVGLALADWLDDAAAWEGTPSTVNHDMRAHDIARLINGGAS